MAGAAQLIARLQARPVPPVPSAENMREPLEAAPAVAVPPVPSVPSRNHHPQGENQPKQLAPAAEAASEPQRIVRTAATAMPEWRAARDQYLNHVMTCRACYAPTGRHCPTGAKLHATYETTPMELTL